MRTQRQEAGDRAEDEAARLLEARGCRVIERNFRTRAGEIDLIVLDRDTVVFVEVRSRSSGLVCGAAESVGSRKRARLIRTARFYAQIRGLDCPLRFDVVAWDAGRLTYLQAAFDAGGR